MNATKIQCFFNKTNNNEKYVKVFFVPLLKKKYFGWTLQTMKKN